MMRTRLVSQGWLVTLGIAWLAAAACQGQNSPAAPAPTPAPAPAGSAGLRATVSGLSPGSPDESAEPTTLVVHGSGFRPGLRATLTDPSGRAAVASGNAILDFTDTSFGLSVALEAGAYSLVVINADSGPSEAFAFSVARRGAASPPPAPPAATPPLRPNPEPAPTPEPPPSSRPAPPPPAACAPLTGVYDSQAPGFIVVFNDGTDVDAAIARLSSKYGFTPTRVYRSALLGFSALLSDRVVEALRCEPVVKYVSYNARVSG